VGSPLGEKNQGEKTCSSSMPRFPRTEPVGKGEKTMPELTTFRDDRGLVEKRKGKGEVPPVWWHEQTIAMTGNQLEKGGKKAPREKLGVRLRSKLSGGKGDKGTGHMTTGKMGKTR